MRRILKLHPDSQCAAVTRVAVDVALSRSGKLLLHYRVNARMDQLWIPPPAEPSRTDELWRRTCFEAFLRTPPEPTYYEFNFSPSRQWAAYRFTGYRSGMTVAHACPAPQIEVRRDMDGCEVRATVDLDWISTLPGEGPWQLGLAAVIEDRHGRRSYWALAHPPGRPDFHHPVCFAHELPATVCT